MDKTINGWHYGSEIPPLDKTGISESLSVMDTRGNKQFAYFISRGEYGGGIWIGEGNLALVGVKEPIAWKEIPEYQEFCSQENLDKSKNTDWISVNQELPRIPHQLDSNCYYSDPVLVICNDKNIAIAVFYNGKSSYSWEDCISGDTITDNVSAWMPLSKAL